MTENESVGVLEGVRQSAISLYPYARPSAKMPEIAPRPAALACAQCRSRHLKFVVFPETRLMRFYSFLATFTRWGPLGRPICRRCANEGSECHYTPSRRGQRRRAQRQSSLGSSPVDLATKNGSTPIVSTSVPERPPPPPLPTPPAPAVTLSAQPPWPATLSPDRLCDPNSLVNDRESTLVEHYFAHFHPAHPILVPKASYNALPLPESLRAVVRYIGSILSGDAQAEAYKHAALLALKRDVSWTAFRVQALLLFAIALYAVDQQTEAQTVLARAVELANLMGMNRYSFATANGAGQAILEESFRRTWWELYVIDGLFAAVHQRTRFRCNTVELDAGLPCEDPIYASGTGIPEAAKLWQFDNRVFDDDENSFSSYCYRIEAVRIMGRVLAISEDPDIEKDSFTEVDNALAGWRYHLPPCKADIARTEKGGEVDELMFQAHLVIHFSTILLHLPRSNLRSIHPLTSPATCCSRQLAPTFSQQNHLMKVIAASQGLSDMSALRTDYDHSPLLASGLILGSLIQLSVCSLHASNCITQHRERVMLMIGVLKSLGRIWPLAHRGLTQVRAYAKEILQRPSTGVAPSVAQEVLRTQSILEPQLVSANAGDHDTAGFMPIDISWMDDILQQPMQYLQSSPPTNGSFDDIFSNL